MRVSANKDDPGYANLRRPIRVLLNGEVCKDAVTADEEEGLVIANKRDDAGKLVVDRERKVVETVTFRGLVKIEYGDQDHSSR